MSNVMIGAVGISQKSDKLNWKKIRAGIYIAKVGNYFIVIRQIKDKNVETTGWWSPVVYDAKGEFLTELENYISLSETKSNVKDNFDRWHEYNT